ncbi:MAG: GlsB/YeaQ/YmgE family stress response membrane protein [Tissierellia bacterium]|nr:GlsB/YeaQ/YmgE family stress response membrane protein [Tissierellia bacterium]
MGIISWLIVGALAGWIASRIMKKDAQMGAVANIVTGIVGGGIGGWIASALGMSKASGINIYSIFISVVGAVILLAILNAIKK